MMVNSNVLRLFILMMFFSLIGYFIYYLQADDVYVQLDETVTGMEKMITLLESGDIEMANDQFDLVQDSFQEIDPTLRAKDPVLARKLWDVHVIIDIQYDSYQPNLELLINAGNHSIALLHEAKEK